MTDAGMTDGVITFYRVKDNPNAGGIPTGEKEFVTQEYYVERTVGFNRYFSAKQNDERADMLVRVSFHGGIGTDMLAKIAPFDRLDDSIYKIVQVQFVYDENNLKAMDVTLQRLEGEDD